jgi:hypothetical protein
VSRRSRRRAGRETAGRETAEREPAGRETTGRGAPGRDASGAEAPGRAEGAPPQRPRGPRSSLAVQLLLLAAVFALAVLVAELLGAANLGVAFGVGQIAFAVALVYVLLRR